jgi:hypothetical protein
LENLQPIKPRRLTIRRFLIYIWFSLLAGILVIILDPVGRAMTRLLLLLAVPAFYLLGLFLIRRYKNILLVGTLPGLFFLLFLFLPSREIDRDRLQVLYIKSLEAYEGTRYIWGGENRLGIDCSGLVRKGLIDANIKLAYLTLNPGPFRTACVLWWYDCSAAALLNGYRQWTRPLFIAESINAIPASRLHPGDLAVTSDGAHVLACLEGKTWIEADPSFQKVIKVKIPTQNPWFLHPVHIIQWTQLR